MKRNENKKSLTKKIVAGTGLALLLALVGYTGANTYAKYITEGQVASQTATVAKWGVVLTASTDNSAFGKDYTKGSGTTATVDTTGNGASVKTIGTTNVVAPGTSGEFTFSISGTPEVASKISFNLTLTSDVHYGDYYPINWTLSGGEFTKTGKLSEIDSYLGDYAKAQEFAPNVAINTTYTLSWEWAFSQGKDKEDTYLGNLASGVANSDVGPNSANASTVVSFAIDARVEQIQK